MRIGFVNTPFPVRPLTAEESRFSSAFFYALFTTSFSNIPENEWRWLPQVERCNLGLLSLSSTLQGRGHECRYFTAVASSEDEEEILTQRILEDLDEVLCDLDLLCV